MNKRLTAARKRRHRARMQQHRKSEMKKHVVTVTVSGPVGCGKSAVYGEIEIALRAIGIPVVHADQKAADYEKWATHADWASELEMYQPTVVLVEKLDKPS